MSRQSKAQVSTEFITLTGIALLIFLALMAIGTTQRSSVNSMDLKLRQTEVCNQLAAAADTAYNIGPGFWYTVVLPTKIREASFVVEADSSTLSVTSGGSTVFCRTFADSLQANSVTGGTVTVRNTNGTITIS